MRADDGVRTRDLRLGKPPADWSQKALDGSGSTESGSAEDQPRAGESASSVREVYESRLAGVYFIAGGGLVKIGRSVNVAQRLAAIQAASPVPVTVELVVAGSSRVEARLHEHFARYRRHGEWFDLPDGWREEALEVASEPAVAVFDGPVGEVAEGLLDDQTALSRLRSVGIHRRVVEGLALHGYISSLDESHVREGLDRLARDQTAARREATA